MKKVDVGRIGVSLCRRHVIGDLGGESCLSSRMSFSMRLSSLPPFRRFWRRSAFVDEVERVCSARGIEIRCQPRMCFVGGLDSEIISAC